MTVVKHWRTWLLAFAFLASAFAMFAPKADATTSGYAGRTAYVSNEDGDREIYSISSDGSDRQKLTNNSYEDVDPVYGMGNKIAFVSNRDGNDEIYVADADTGNNVVRFTNYSGWDYKPTFSPDGNTLTWVRQPNSGDSELVSMSVSTPEPTGTPTSVTSNTEMDDNPSYAQDGRLVWDRTINLGQKRLVIKELNGTNTAMSTQGSCDEWNPDFKPDGTRIAYVKCNSNSADVMSIKPDGTDRQFAAASSGKDWQPSYSADGTYLTWSSNYDKEEVAIGTDLNIIQQDLGSVWSDNTGMSNTYDEQLPTNRPVDPKQTVIWENVTSPDYTLGTESAEISFERVDGDTTATFQCRIDGGSWSTCTSPKTYTGLALGTQHTFEVKSTVGGVTENPKSEVWTDSATAPPADTSPTATPSAAAVAAPQDTKGNVQANVGLLSGLSEFLSHFKALMGSTFTTQSALAMGPNQGQKLVVADGHVANTAYGNYGSAARDANHRVPEKMVTFNVKGGIGHAIGKHDQTIEYEIDTMNKKWSATGCGWDMLARHERAHTRGLQHTGGSYPNNNGNLESGENPAHYGPGSTGKIRAACHYPGQYGEY